MINTEGREWVEKLRKRWVISSAGKVLLLSLAFALFVYTLLFYFFGMGGLGFMLSFLLVFVWLSLKVGYWKIGSTQMTRFIDLHYPEAGESSGLLLKPAANLSFLERMQATKVNAALVVRKQPNAPFRQLKIPSVVFLLSVLIYFVSLHLPAFPYLSKEKINQKETIRPVVKENIPPQISSIEVRITPPAYTRKPGRKQSQFTIQAESGAIVQWKIYTSKPIKNVVFLFNDREKVHLKPLDGSGTSWFFSKVIRKPGFYQVLLDGSKSDFYQIVVTEDQPVVIRISKPAQHSTIDIGRPQQVNLSVSITDDYGVSDAYIMATMASGKGEAVSFKERKMLFSTSFNQQRTLKINKLISLRELGMKPGDELYFYIYALDNRGQQSRSDTYFVSIQDTTELMSMAGIDNGINLVPEYFRSQRQIIIDTEKLLKEKSTLAEAEFKSRSNNLGIDQKMLRLRYGKFLGEESETNIGGGHTEEGHDHEGEGLKDEHHEGEHHESEHHDAEPAKFGDVQSVMDQYAHKHDNAEDATFFEPELKAQLKATLNEMWSAELRLRTYVPQEALPFEYKALRLLKDLQQKSRAYVAKTTVKTSPLKAEKRLTGELTEIKSSRTKGDFSAEDRYNIRLKRTLGVLEMLKGGKNRTANDVLLLMQVEQQFITAASVAPSLYLQPLKAVKTIIGAGQNGTVTDAHLAMTEKGINLLLDKEEVRPYRAANTSSSALTRSYFNHLKRTGQ